MLFRLHVERIGSIDGEAASWNSLVILPAKAKLGRALRLLLTRLWITWMLLGSGCCKEHLPGSRSSLLCFAKRSFHEG